MGYLNTGSETNIIQAEEITYYITPIEVIEENGLYLTPATAGTTEVTFYFDKRIESENNSHHTDIVLTSGDNRGSPTHFLILT